jgi:hypothetical protein
MSYLTRLSVSGGIDRDYYLLCFVRLTCFPLFVVVPLLSETESVRQLLSDGLFPGSVENVSPMAEMIIDRLESVGCKTALRLAERAIATAGLDSGKKGEEREKAQLAALTEILDDLAGDEVTATRLCEVF